MKIKLKKYSEPEKIEITSDFIKLDSLLKFAVLVGSGGEAKQLIADEYVLVNNQVCTQRGKKIYPGDTVELGGKRITVVKAE